MITNIITQSSSYTEVQVAGNTMILSNGVQYGPAGADAWTPVLGVAVDGARRVIEVLDWVDGSGTKPDLGYLSATGVDPDIANAVDIRGAAGVGSVSQNTFSIAISAQNVTDGYFTLPHSLTLDTRKSIMIYADQGAIQRNHEVQSTNSDYAVGSTNTNRVYIKSGDYTSDSDQDLTGQLSDLIVENDWLVVSYLHA